MKITFGGKGVRNNFKNKEAGEFSGPPHVNGNAMAYQVTGLKTGAVFHITATEYICGY